MAELSTLGSVIKTAYQGQPLAMQDADKTKLNGIAAGATALTIGTTATTAMAGNTPIPAAPTWANIAGKPAVVAEGATQAAARTSIGAGTSSLALGTTAGTAMAGNTPIPAAYTLPAAGAALGGVLEGAAVADAVDETDVVVQFNALLASLRASGAIA